MAAPSQRQKTCRLLSRDGSGISECGNACAMFEAATQESPEKPGDSPVMESPRLHFKIRVKQTDAPATIHDPCQNILDALERVDSGESG